MHPGRMVLLKLVQGDDVNACVTGAAVIVFFTLTLYGISAELLYASWP
jgi:hypothetical protein